MIDDDPLNGTEWMLTIRSIERRQNGRYLPFNEGRDNLLPVQCCLEAKEMMYFFKAYKSRKRCFFPYLFIFHSSRSFQVWFCFFFVFSLFSGAVLILSFCNFILLKSSGFYNNLSIYFSFFLSFFLFIHFILFIWLFSSFRSLIEFSFFLLDYLSIFYIFIFMFYIQFLFLFLNIFHFTWSNFLLQRIW